MFVSFHVEVSSFFITCDLKRFDFQMFVVMLWGKLLNLTISGNIWEGGSHLSQRKVDRCILELQMEAEDMYSRFRNAIENVWLGEWTHATNHIHHQLYTAMITIIKYQVIVLP